MAARLVASLGTAVALASACASGSSARAPVSSVRQTPAPKPTSTLLTAGANCHAALGGSVSFEDRTRGLAVRIATAKPKVVTHALAAYAHGPANGRYLIVDVKLTNLSLTPLRLDPTHFVFTTSSGRRLTVDSANAPYSGASRVLDPTFLVAGATEHGPLIYDTPQAHGRIAFTNAGKTACTWTV